MNYAKTKLYPNYFRRASNRLSSCKYLLELCKTSNTLQLEALRDIYYLSGYILEGFCIYSIYKLYGWNEETPIDGSEGMESWEINTFYSKTHLRFSNNDNNKKNDRAEYEIKGHNFQKYVELIICKPQFRVLNFSYLSPPLADLVNNWKPAIRYVCDICISIEKLSQLLDYCTKVQKVIITEVGYD